ncbi:hypothetical protein AAVH_03766 [Aphelenchoides avenae]|nr:hypothetical protein AAVH_03766 [Aphelenchus avenae]
MLLFVLACFLGSSTRFGIADAKFACTEQSFCDDEFHRQYWGTRRQNAEWIIEARELTNRTTFALKSKLDELRTEKHLLCSDFRVAGFLMQNGSDMWPIACLWMGNDFRRSLDCPKEDIDAVKTAKELFICRERCVQAGVGYITQLVLIFSLTGLAGVMLTRAE